MSVKYYCDWCSQQLPISELEKYEIIDFYTGQADMAHIRETTNFKFAHTICSECEGDFTIFRQKKGSVK